MNGYCRLIPRLNGEEIEDRLPYYLGLVKKGIAGFILFGGELRTVREGLRRLQEHADGPLIIASDLEQGLGQQVQGGTLFPPAMAIASACEKMEKHAALTRLQELYSAFAREARYTGINTILAPVLDINTNPLNPIIATRAFGEDAETVSFFGCEMVSVLAQNHILSCGKHFPGHGDTEQDSHISLPAVVKGMELLNQAELIPFRKAIGAGVPMIMLGHLKVPALEPSGLPVSMSANAVSYLRNDMNFPGIIITDAMNMGALQGIPEHDAALRALRAGVDIILHPSDPDAVASFIQQKNCQGKPLTLTINSSSEAVPDFAGHRELSDTLSEMAISTVGKGAVRKPFVILIDDEDRGRGQTFVNTLRSAYPTCLSITIPAGAPIPWDRIPPDCEIVVSLFSQVRAWKGPLSSWLQGIVNQFRGKARCFISFGNPYIIRETGDALRIYAYWNSDAVQRAVARRLFI